MNSGAAAGAGAFALAALLAVLGLCLVHLFSNKLRCLEGLPRAIWLSLSGGVSVGYVFVHMLPELNRAQQTVEESAGWSWLEHHVYLVALLGLSVFYWLERAAHESRRRNIQQSGEDVTSPRVFWLHIVVFALYNSLIGYLLLHRDESGLQPLLLFTFAMALHFVASDFGLNQHHKEAYSQMGRWILVAAILLGWGVGSVTQINSAAVGVLFAFVAGGVVLNVLKEELPEDRQSRYWAFAVGAFGYAAVLALL